MAKKKPIDVHVGQRIKSRRELLKHPVSTLAVQVHIPTALLVKYESGQERVPSKTLVDIGIALGVSIFYFFEDSKG